MRLWLQTDYSVRVLAHLRVNTNKLATIQEVSDVFDISRDHLIKVAHQLGKFVYVEAIRGKNGGLRLTTDPNVINIGVLVRQIEPGLVIVDCIVGMYLLVGLFL